MAAARRVLVSTDRRRVSARVADDVGRDARNRLTRMEQRRGGQWAQVGGRREHRVGAERVGVSFPVSLARRRMWPVGRRLRHGRAAEDTDGREVRRRPARVQVVVVRSQGVVEPDRREADGVAARRAARPTVPGSLGVVEHVVADVGESGSRPESRARSSVVAALADIAAACHRHRVEVDLCGGVGRARRADEDAGAEVARGAVATTPRWSCWRSGSCRSWSSRARCPQPSK